MSDGSPLSVQGQKDFAMGSVFFGCHSWSDILCFRWRPAIAHYSCAYNGSPMFGFSILATDMGLANLTEGTMFPMRPGVETFVSTEGESSLIRQVWFAGPSLKYILNLFWENIIAN